LKLLTKTDKITIKRFENREKVESDIGIGRIVEFLHKHLEEYGDDRQAIRRSIDYAFSNEEGKGGFVLVAMEGEKVLGVSVINDTGMKGYIPEHILVYIAVDKTARGTGIGKKLIKQIKRLCNGDIALHVEQNNPARFLYEKMGFKTKYAEMRFTQE
jgi:GNAT superfamily N-acetyltransferase